MIFILYNTIHQVLFIGFSINYPSNGQTHKKRSEKLPACGGRGENKKIKPKCFIWHCGYHQTVLVIPDRYDIACIRNNFFRGDVSFSRFFRFFIISVGDPRKRFYVRDNDIIRGEFWYFGVFFSPPTDNNTFGSHANRMYYRYNRSIENIKKKKQSNLIFYHKLL